VFFVILQLYPLCAELNEKEIISEGVKYEREGKIDEAISIYREFLESNPGSYSVSLRLITLLVHNRRHEEIKEVYEGFDESVQKRKEIISLIARSYLQTGEKKKASHIIRKIIIYEDSTKISFSYTGNLFLSLRMMNDAKLIFLEGRKRYGKGTFARELYICYMRTGEKKNAMEELINHYRQRGAAREWIVGEVVRLVQNDKDLILYLEEIAEDDVEINQIIGEVYLSLGEFDRAKTYLLQSMNPAAIIQFSTICLKQGCYREAEESLSKLIRELDWNKTKEEALFILSQVQSAEENYDGALESLDDIIAHGVVLKDSAIVEKARILIYYEKKYEDGIRTIESILKNKHVYTHDKIVQIAVIGYIKIGALEKAEKILQKGDSGLILFLRGEVLFLSGSYKESVDAYLSAVSKGLDKDYANDALDKVMVIEELMEYPPLLAFVRDIEESIWMDKSEYGLNLTSEGFNKFKKEYEKIVILYYKARLCVTLRRFNEAISAYLSIKDEDAAHPFSPKAMYKAALIYQRKIKNMRMAEDLFREIIFEYPESVEAELSRYQLDFEDE
jgi:tetratricopeptide (TPR) repeat protein